MRPSESEAPSHVDPDQLSLGALGEELPEADAAHVRRCERCRGELEALRAVVVAARGESDAPAVVPPPEVWDRVAAATGVRVDRREALGDVPGDEPRDEPGDEPRDEPGDEPGHDELGRRRRRRAAWVPLAAVAAASLVVGAVVGVAVSRGADDDGRVDVAGPGEGTVLEQTSLDPLVTGGPTGGLARVVEADGHRELRLRVPGLSARDDGFYEVWLLADTGRMVPVGVLVGGESRWPLPPGLDVGDYPVVDVSLEPYDGDPTHSGDSLLRGTLRT